MSPGSVLRYDHEASMDAITQTSTDSQELRLKELVVVLWRGRLLIACVTALFTLAAVVGAFLMPKMYEASIVISPVSASSRGGALGGSGVLNALGSQLGGLAAIAGLSVGTESKKVEAVAVLQSEALTETYIQQNNLLPVLFYQQWDAAGQKWKVKDPKDLPTLWKAYRFFKQSVRTLGTDNKTGLVTLTITWRDPQVAANWANGLVKLANDYLRDRAITQSERNITYLYQEAAKTNVVEARQAIYAVLETEINEQMLARGTNEYAFRVLDPARPPEKAAFPQKVVWLLMGMFGGLLLSCLVVLVRTAWSRAG
jgi:uncharacterized protein involved in exopolysaccharide biosynthesis